MVRLLAIHGNPQENLPAGGHSELALGRRDLRNLDSSTGGRDLTNPPGHGKGDFLWLRRVRFHFDMLAISVQAVDLDGTMAEDCELLEF